ncbi:HXXEE domain-containing protein [Paraburkholderia sp. SARCC-3016]|uniref:HXXEE domain-containing protein n=1 Tax=Paraburkholderia sp. SARCC-3016 TaxID=3058611 RepID=UPI002809F983|nr:HXXEE domain-containing protein [Paraburkholderia sp. SARCC-3016]MDQ7981690.1 HXXEE domain-containing protein [Paraburkholderia sp. SARCC-3016]
MQWSGFDLAFPWIGGLAALVLLVLLFGTDVLRSGSVASRWRDPVWMSWMATVAYLLHNVEEYGVDLLGHSHAFPNALCASLALAPFPACPIPPAFFLAVNIPLFWIVGPLAALLSPRHRLVGFALYSVIAINGVMHVATVFRTGQLYNPGLLTALLLFLPLTAWVGYAFFGKARLSYKAMALLPACGVLLHVFLAGTTIMFIKGFISATVLIWSQIINAGLLLAVM